MLGRLGLQCKMSTRKAQAARRLDFSKSILRREMTSWPPAYVGVLSMIPSIVRQLGNAAAGSSLIGVVRCVVKISSHGGLCGHVAPCIATTCRQICVEEVPPPRSLVSETLVAKVKVDFLLQRFGQATQIRSEDSWSHRRRCR